MTPFESVREFHQQFRLPISDLPNLPSEDERRLRMNLLEEEYIEYTDAEVEDNLVEIADALADMIYIICGTALSYGIPLDKIFEEVHRSNMTKLGENGPIYNEVGKVMKPETYEKPDIERVLYGN